MRCTRRSRPRTRRALMWTAPTKSTSSRVPLARRTRGRKGEVRGAGGAPRAALAVGATARTRAPSAHTGGRAPRARRSAPPWPRRTGRGSPRSFGGVYANMRRRLTARRSERPCTRHAVQYVPCPYTLRASSTSTRSWPCPSAPPAAWGPAASSSWLQTTTAAGTAPSRRRRRRVRVRCQLGLVIKRPGVRCPPRTARRAPGKPGAPSRAAT
mmetsp:Transcript_17332/g.53791  ORF Transcript_17332/g.53791 Transcript_17332/m.53791 type:complete len:212 (-) Transcript_17332:3544-4179(-)